LHSQSPAPIRRNPSNDRPLSHRRRAALRALVIAGIASIPLTVTAQEGAKRAESPGPSSTIVRPPTAAERAALQDQARRDSVVRMARSQLGRRYIFGGTTTNGFDCSGFTRYLMRALGYDVPRTAAQQARVGREVPKDLGLLRPGDLVTFGFGRGNRVTHIGVYVGDGKYIHASSAQGRVVESRLGGSRLVRAWRGVRRLLSDSDSTTSVATAGVLPGSR
jgi:cell wall-associated NlpC family hydrolase